MDLEDRLYLSEKGKNDTKRTAIGAAVVLGGTVCGRPLVVLGGAVYTASKGYQIYHDLRANDKKSQR